jgi:hypothetical protein
MHLHSAHLSSDVLEQYSMGKLAEPTLVEDHLFVCDLCRQRLEETEQFLRNLRHALREGERTVDETKLRGCD